MKKLILGIFISLGAIFLMSHNVNAASLSYNLNDYDWITSVNLGTQYCAYSYNNFGSSPSICILTKNQSKMFGIKSYDLPHEKDDLAQFYISVQNNIYSNDSSFSMGSFGLYLDNFGSINDHFKIISFEQVDAESVDWANYINSGYNCTVTYPTSTVSQMQCTSSSQNVNDVYRIYTKIYKVTILWTDRGSNPVVLNALNANMPLAKCFIEPNLVNNTAGQCQVKLFGYTQWGYKGSSVNKEQADATQEAADNSESSGNSSQSDSQGATSNLLSVFTGFANVITNASPSSCVVNAPLNTAFSNDRLNVDLCGLDLPPAIGALTSIIAVMVVVPFAVSMFNKFIGIMQGFQR